MPPGVIAGHKRKIHTITAIHAKPAGVPHRYTGFCPPDGAAAEGLRNFADGGSTMNGRPIRNIDRRDVLRVFAIGAAAATTTACSSVEGENFPDKRKAAYRADSPEVQTFYRVNRYPAK
jgi:hypothetical protein